MTVNESWETLTDGWWNDTDTSILENNDVLVGGFWEWGETGVTLEMRVERIEDFLRNNKFIKINSIGDETEVLFPW